MSQKEKLIAKLKARSDSFTFAEAESLLGMLGYKRDNKGRTSGSRVIFINEVINDNIMLHKPHPRKELLDYQTKQLLDFLNPPFVPTEIL